MHHERLELVDLFTDMCSGEMEYIPVKWEYMSSDVNKEHKQTEYMRRLQKCEICIVMFWRSFGEYTEKELSLALKEQQSGQEHNLQKTFILFKEDGEPISPELSEFKKKCMQEHGDIVRSFSNSQELRELARNLVLSANVKCNESTWDGKEVKVMIAADEELNEEKLEFTELMAHLNEVLENRGIRLRRVKWTPQGADDLQKELHDCEMCLNLYWTKLPQQADEEMKAAYELTTNGTNPQHLYVFFKEKPSDKITAALADFKASFETVYGHFFCKFENVDTMNLHFILQFEAKYNNMQEDLTKFSEGRIFFGDNEIVHLDKVPFAALNKEYQRFMQELKKLDVLVKELRKRYKEDPDNENLENELFAAKIKRKNLDEEFEKHQQHLYNIALSFAKYSGERCSERMRKARELFEMGNNIEADEALNIDEMRKEVEKERKIRQNLKQLSEQNQNNLEKKVEEFRLKADTVMGNTLLPPSERFTIASESYQESIDLARDICYDDNNLSHILHDYACFLKKFNRLSDAMSYYREALVLYRKLAEINSQTYLPYVGMALNNLANTLKDLKYYSDAENCYMKALRIRRQLAEECPQAFLSQLATTLNNLSLFLSIRGRHAEAEKYCFEALNIRKELAVEAPEKFLPDLAMSLNSVAILKSDQGYYSNAEDYCKCSLEIYKMLKKNYQIEYRHDWAGTLNNLANYQCSIGRKEEAEKTYLEALDVYGRLSDEKTEEYLPNYAETLTNLANLRISLEQYSKAEMNYCEAIKIFRELAKDTPEVFVANLTMTLNDQVNLQKKIGKYAEAESGYLEMLRYYQSVAKDNENYLSKVAETMNNYAAMLCNIGRYFEAGELFQEALGIFIQLGNDNIEGNAFKMAQSYGALSYISIFKKQFVSAENYAYQGLAKDPTQHWIYSNLAASFLFQGKTTEAELLYCQYQVELKDTYLDDFKRFEELGIIPKERKEDVERIKRMLNDE